MRVGAALQCLCGAGHISGQVWRKPRLGMAAGPTPAGALPACQARGSVARLSGAQGLAGPGLEGSGVPAGEGWRDAGRREAWQGLGL